MQPHIEVIRVETRGQGFIDVTGRVAEGLACAGARDGLMTLFVQHTSASLTIQENADPDVRTDLRSALDRFAPEDGPYVHTIEGPDDMPAHIKTMLTQTSLAVPVSGGNLMLGTWQGIYLIEHRSAPHRRSLALHFAGTYR